MNEQSLNKAIPKESEEVHLFDALSTCWMLTIVYLLFPITDVIGMGLLLEISEWNTIRSTPLEL